MMRKLKKTISSQEERKYQYFVKEHNKIISGISISSSANGVKLAKAMAC